MEEVFVLIFFGWFAAATVGAVNNIVAQTPDTRIITQCKEQGYIAVKQTIVKCSIDKEVK